nr:hypothetical protein [Sphingomonas koreensis]
MSMAAADLKGASTVRRRFRLIHAKTRATTQRLGGTAKPDRPVILLTISALLLVVWVTRSWL